MAYQSAFPDFDAMPAIPATGWTDCSYRNDSCPSFEVMTGFDDTDSNYLRAVVWIDYEDAAAREFQSGKRFSVCYYEATEENPFTGLETDSWSEVLAYVQIRQAMGAAYSSQVGYNPFLDDPAIDPAEVLQALLAHVAASYSKGF